MKKKLPDELKHLRCRCRDRWLGDPDNGGVLVDRVDGIMDLIRYYDAFNDDDSIDWRKLALSVIDDCYPFTQPASSPGRPRVDHSDLVVAVEDLRKERGCSARSAADILRRRGAFGDIDVYSAYRRAKQRKSRGKGTDE